MWPNISFYRLFEFEISALIDDLVRGLVSQEGDLWDNSFTPAVQDHLFESGNGNGAGGLDLVALNIQRGRDHGLPGSQTKLLFSSHLI